MIGHLRSGFGIGIAITLLLVLPSWFVLPPSIVSLARGSGATTLGVWSETYKTRSPVDTSLLPGQNIVFEVNVTDVHVPRFNGLDITLRYNPTVLNATIVDHTGGLFASALCLPTSIDRTAGIVRESCVLLGSSLTDVDSGTLFTIDFEIAGNGDSIVDIDETVSDLTDNVEYTSLDGFFTNRAGVRNVGVLSVSTNATNELAIQGESVSVSVTVMNQGTIDELVTVEAYANSSQIGTGQTASISALGQVTLAFLWDTTGLSPGLYRIRGVATTSVQDAFSGDNALDVELVVLAIRNMALGNLRLSTNVLTVNYTYEGFLNVTLRNEGTIQETANVTVSYNGTVFGRAPVAVPAGQERLVQFDWNTTDVPPGVYVLAANVTALTGETDLTDNTSYSSPVQVFQTLSHDLEVVSVSRAGLSRVVIGSNVTVQLTVRNNGPFRETFNASLFLGSTLLNAWTNRNISTLTSLTLGFTWDTDSNLPGNYLLKANATIPNDQIPGNNEKTGVTLSFVQNTSPYPVYASSPSSQILAGQQLQFNATGSYDVDGEIVSYTWNFGDGAGAVGKVVTHVYNTGGVYFLSLTVTDDLGRSSTLTNSLTVESTPSPPASGQPDYLLPALAGAGVVAVAGVLAVLWRKGRLKSAKN